MTSLAPKRILAAVASERPTEALLRAWTVPGQVHAITSVPHRKFAEKQQGPDISA